jgi:hypothetical protein
MDVIVEQGERIYSWLGLTDLAAFASPFRGSPYTCLLWDASGNWASVERHILVRALLGSGCRYLVCGGETCELWHDDADELLALESATSASDGSEILVGTTWHTGESPESVAEFFVMHGIPLVDPPRKHLVLQLGGDWDLQCELSLWVRGWVEHPYGEDVVENAG